MRFSTQANTYELPKVILAPVLDEIQSNDSNLEPPMVRLRAANSAILCLDSTADMEGTSSQFIIGGGSEQPPVTTRKIKRIAFKQYIGTANSPNINPRNNQLIFRSSTDGFVTDHVATIPPGIYSTVNQALPALITALNAAVPASGLTFSSGPYSPAAGSASDPQRARLQSAGGTFAFAPNGSMSRFGRYLYGIPFLPFIPPGEGIPSPAQFAAQATANLPIGQMLLIATRWVDIVSLGINEYTKNPSSGNDFGGNNLVARLWTTQPTQNPSTASMFPLPSVIEVNKNWTNYERTRQMASLDFALIDEFGQTLYRAPLGLPADPPIAQLWSNDFTELTFLTEL